MTRDKIYLTENEVRYIHNNKDCTNCYNILSPNIRHNHIGAYIDYKFVKDMGLLSHLDDVSQKAKSL